MSYEQKPGTGTLFRNKNKQPGSSAPGYKGFFLLPSGEVVGLALWVKETRDGDKLFSLAIDDREGDYQAKKLGKPKHGAPVESSKNGRDFAAGKSDRERAGFGRSDNQRSDIPPDDDFSDEIPF